MDCGLDYLRVTALENEPQLMDVLHGVKAMQDAQEDAGHKRLRSGEEGFVGEVCGSWRWGYRSSDGRMLLQASSEQSAVLLDTLKRTQLDCQGTRVDLHCTYERKRYDGEWAIEMRNLLRDSEESRGIKRQVKARIWDDPQNGNTLETYSRKSRRYFRDYHKAAEQKLKLPESTFRCEGEWKRELARLMYRKVLHCVDVRMLALDVLQHEWERLGIDRNWDWKGQPVDMHIEKRPADQVRTARWFINSAATAFHSLTDPDLIAQCLEAILTEPETGAYKTFEAPTPEPPPRPTRQQAAAAARKKIKENMELAPLDSWKYEHVCKDDCACPESLGARMAKEAMED